MKDPIKHFGFDPANYKWLYIGLAINILGFLLIMLALLIPSMGGAEKVIISINSLLVLPLLAPTLWGMFSRSIGFKEMCIGRMILGWIL